MPADRIRYASPPITPAAAAHDAELSVLAAFSMSKKAPANSAVNHNSERSRLLNRITYGFNASAVSKSQPRQPPSPMRGYSAANRASINGKASQEIHPAIGRFSELW